MERAALSHRCRATPKALLKVDQRNSNGLLSTNRFSNRLKYNDGDLKTNSFFVSNGRQASDSPDGMYLVSNLLDFGNIECNQRLQAASYRDKILFKQGKL